MPRPDLNKFVDAQQAIYSQVVDELRRGEKCSHWMWFIFPQLAGLGSSPTAIHYAIKDMDEACAYLDHEVLGARLTECTGVMLGWAEKRSATAILGSIDTLKFRSSMTLFEIAAESDAHARLFADALEAFYDGRRDERTLHLLEPGRDSGKTA